MPVYENVCPQSLQQHGLPIAADSLQDDGNSRSKRNWGIASFFWHRVMSGVEVCIQPLRKCADVEPAENTQAFQDVMPSAFPEDTLNQASGADQRIWYPRRMLDGESYSLLTHQYALRAPQEQAPGAAGKFWPDSYFGWFVLITIVQAFTVVPIVWILAVVIF